MEQEKYVLSVFHAENLFYYDDETTCTEAMIMCTDKYVTTYPFLSGLFVFYIHVCFFVSVYS